MNRTERKVKRMRTKVRMTPEKLNAKIASLDVQNFKMLFGAEVGHECGPLRDRQQRRWTQRTGGLTELTVLSASVLPCSIKQVRLLSASL